MCVPIGVWAQQPPETDGGPSKVAATEQTARVKILQSAQWRRLLRSFDEWLSVQNIHTDEQIDICVDAFRSVGEELGVI